MTDLTLPENGKAFIIGLQRTAAKRGRPTREAWRKTGLELEWWEGVDGDRDLNLRPGEKVSWRLPFSPFIAYDINLSHPGVKTRIIACFLSHYRLWKHCLEAGHGRVLILEDDILPDDSLVTIWPELWALEDSFEVVKIFSMVLPSHMKFKDSACREYALHHFKTPGYILHRPFNCTLGTCGYLATRGGLQKLVDGAMPVRYSADAYLDGFQEHGAGVFCLNPRSLHHHYHIPSSISGGLKQLAPRGTLWEAACQKVFLGIKYVVILIYSARQMMAVLRAPRGAFYPPHRRHPPRLFSEPFNKIKKRSTMRPFHAKKAKKP